MLKIVVSNFALGRHFTPGKQYSYCAIPQYELVGRVVEDFVKCRDGYRKGVILVPLSVTNGIFSPVTVIDEHNKHLLRAVFEPRQPGEKPFKKMVIDTMKSQAKHVDVVLYHRDVLAEDKDNTDVTADWEVVSVNARITKEPEPMTPTAMARNMAHLEGGTAGKYTAEEFVQSLLYWADKAMATR
jgi:hypothetical protein